MQTLNFPIDFDQDNTFTFAYIGIRGQERTATGYLFHDDSEDKIHVMQKSAMLKSSYTSKDTEERTRLNAMKPLRTDDLVEVDGVKYKVRINGNYSNAGYLIKI